MLGDGHVREHTDPDLALALEVAVDRDAGGFEPGVMTVPEIDAYIQTEIKRLGEVIRAAGIKAE